MRWIVHTSFVDPCTDLLPTASSKTKITTRITPTPQKQNWIVKTTKINTTSDLTTTTAVIALKKTITFQQLRDEQVKAMIAGKRFTACDATPWPEPSESMKRTWNERHPSFKTYSSHYLSAQLRLLFLADLEPETRFEEFERICFLRRLAPTTAETYWTTFLSIQKSLSLKPSVADARVTKLLKARSVAFPVNFPEPATTNDIRRIISMFKNSSFTPIVVMTFLNGQRISDMIQLAVADLVPQSEFLLITVRRGKTFLTQNPYTLWMRRHTFPTEELIQLRNRAEAAGRIFLLSNMNSDEERERVLDEIRSMLNAVNDNLELRSIRRGGLHLMGTSGHSLETILNFSRHADQKMLMRYLNWGSVAADRRDEMMTIMDTQVQSMML